MTVLHTTGNPHGEIRAHEVQTHGPQRPATLTAEAACKLVVQDAARAEQFLDTKQWALGWREADVMYQSARTTQSWENGATQRANVNRFTTAKHVNALVPTVMSGMFYDTPPFVLRPDPGTHQSTVRAKSSLFACLLRRIRFKQECERGIHSQVNKGTVIFKWGWCSETKIVKKYVRKKSAARVKLPFEGERQVHTAESDEFEVREVKVTESKPFFEFRPLGTVMADPGCRYPNEIWRGKYVIDRQYLTFNDLNKLRDQPGYDIPAEEELKRIFFPPVEVAAPPSGTERMQQSNLSIHQAEGRDKQTTEDPLELPLKVDERWDGERVMTVVQDKLLIRNEEHKLGCIPFLSANWWDIENALYGIGVGRLVGADQRVEQGAMNAALDILALAVNPMSIRSRSANAPTQQIRSKLGGIVDVDGDVNKAFRWMETPRIPPEVWTIIGMSKESSESTSGADQAFVQGNIPGKGSSVTRSATGAAGVAAATATRIQGPVGRFVDNVFIPFLEHLDEMVRERMPASEIREILGDELGQQYELDFDNFYNGGVKFEVLAGAHLAAKKAMAQALPFLIQLLENPHLVDSLNKMGWMVDVKEIFAMALEISEWKNDRDLIRRMTKEELAMFEKQTSAVSQKLQADIAKLHEKQQGDQQLTDQKIEGRMAEHLLDTSIERATAYEERVTAEHEMRPFAQGEAQYSSTGG